MCNQLKTELIDEFRIDASQSVAIRELLAASFPEASFTASRIYAKQVPGRRFLATKDGRLVGHVALEHRVIGTTDGPVKIFGIIDVCVATSHRGQGIASQLLGAVETLAGDFAVDFLMLFADDARLYERNGFVPISNRLRWMKVHEHETIGIGDEPVEEAMIKSVSDRSWPSGVVDLLGYLF